MERPVSFEDRAEKELAVRTCVTEINTRALTEVPLGRNCNDKICRSGPPEERTRITEIQDFLIERFVEHREAIEEGHEVRAKALEAEINELQREMGNVTKWAAVGSA
jgi:hypothetical protein